VSKYEYDSDAAFAVMDANHNNRISANELQGLLGPQQDGHPSAAERIGVADVNGDEELSDEELRRALEIRFNWLDTNRDGNLDLPEMTSGFAVNRSSGFAGKMSVTWTSDAIPGPRLVTVMV